MISISFGIFLFRIEKSILQKYKYSKKKLYLFKIGKINYLFKI